MGIYIYYKVYLAGIHICNRYILQSILQVEGRMERLYKLQGICRR